jgi:hypothetical protein
MNTDSSRTDHVTSQDNRINWRGAGTRRADQVEATRPNQMERSKTRLIMPSRTNLRQLVLMALVGQIILAQLFVQVSAKPTVLLRVCDAKQVKTVTTRVCMLYKRTKNSNVKRDKQGNLRMTKRQVKGEYSPAKLASDCCKIGCPPHIFASIC